VISSVTSSVVLPGVVGPESIPFIMAILVAAFVISSVHDRLKKKNK
jgi:hypothetical protein